MHEETLWVKESPCVSPPWFATVLQRLGNCHAEATLEFVLHTLTVNTPSGSDKTPAFALSMLI